MLLRHFKWLTLTTRIKPRRIGLSFCFKNKREVCESVIQGTSMEKHLPEEAVLPEPLCFNSRSKQPNDKFSNFYEAKIEMAEGCFNSVEHYFQSMKFIDENHSRFAFDGDLGKGTSSGSWKPTVSKGRFIKTAGSKSGTSKYGLTVRSGGLDRGRAKRKMKDGLRKKFENEPFKTLLLETHKRPLVHTPMRGKTDYWTARVDKIKKMAIVGENNMGNLLMQVRKELQEHTKNYPGKESKEKEDESGTTNEKQITNKDNVCPVRVRKRHHDDSEEMKGGKSNKLMQSEESKEKEDESGTTNEKQITNKDNVCQVRVRKRHHDDSEEMKVGKSNKQMQSEEPDAKRKKTEFESDGDQTKTV